MLVSGEYDPAWLLLTPSIADTDFATGPAIGAADLVRHVNNRLATCPNTKFVLIGYSQGAMVTGKSPSIVL